RSLPLHLTDSNVQLLTMMTTKNSELFSLNVPPIVECIRTMNAILVFRTILQSSRLWDGGKQIMHCFRIWPRWQGIHWLYPRPDVLSNVCSVFLDELQLGKDLAFEIVLSRI